MASEQRYLTTLEIAGGFTNEDPGLIGAGDDDCASTTGSNVWTGNFSMGFSSVSGTIEGIVVTVHGSVNSNDDYYTVELTDSVAGVVTQNTATLGQNYPTCSLCQDGTVGAVDDLWGGTWTDAHIKSSSFQLRLRAKASGKSGAGWIADSVSVTVYYAEAGTEEEVMLID